MLISLGVITSLPIIALASVLNVNVFQDNSIQLYTGAISTTDTYDYGYCTYWSSLRREQTGKPIPNNWGNANTWSFNAIIQGYKVDHNPTAGAIMQTSAGQLGHVAYVESVSPSDGSWTISEMNYKGWDVVDNRTLKASDTINYNFIH